MINQSNLEKDGFQDRQQKNEFVFVDSNFKANVYVKSQIRVEERCACQIILLIDQ